MAEIKNGDFREPEEPAGFGNGRKLVIAGGVTGGHLFPGVAIAQEFLRADSRNAVLFVSAGRPMERTILSKAGFELRAIDVQGIKGRGRFNQLAALFKLPGAVWNSSSVLKQFKADLVLGVGGFAAGPVLLAARLRGIPCALQEQNMLPGITNRILSRWVGRIYVSFPESRGYFDPEKTLLTGNPVRRQILEAARKQQKDKAGIFTVLVFGGSQGAHAVNMAVVEALGFLKGMPMRFIHQTGAADFENIRKAYEDQGASNRVQAFFDDMGALYEQADLVICRAGATTVAELAVMGKPAIFVPFPFAADDHQTLNARSLVKAGAAEMIPEQDLTGENLAGRMQYYYENPEILSGMAARAGQFGKPDAAAVIVADCLRICSETGC